MVAVHVGKTESPILSDGAGVRRLRVIALIGVVTVVLLRGKMLDRSETEPWRVLVLEEDDKLLDSLLRGGRSGDCNLGPDWMDV